MIPDLYPSAKQICESCGAFKFKAEMNIHFSFDLKPVIDTIKEIYSDLTLYHSDYSSADIYLIFAKGLKQEEYEISIFENKIDICYSSLAGAFYGLITLCNMLESANGSIPCMNIKDFPDLKIRGVMLDISRGKVPTLDTLKYIADRLATIKINQLQLYLEGFSFAYPKYKEMWENETPLTSVELQELDAYCKARFIDLVPCQNSFGHMASWLAEEKFNHLAESPQGFTIKGFTFPPTTLDPCDDEGFAFVEDLFEQLLPNFSSSRCNACMDEPFELGMGKNSNKNKYKIYAEYANKLNAFLNKKGKQMMMWGDILAKAPDVLSDLSENIMVLDWGYEAEHPVEKRARMLAETNRHFCLCPGTNSWLSFTGMTENMFSCITRTAKAAKTYGADGMITTDWGDCGHLQYLPVSWAGILLGAALSWSSEEISQNQLADTLDEMIFKDKNKIMGKLALDAGRYVKFEEFELPCRTLASTVLNQDVSSKEAYEKGLFILAKSINFFSCEEISVPYLKSYDSRKEFKANELLVFLKDLYNRLTKSDMQCKDAKLILDEYRNALLMVEIASKLRNAVLNDMEYPELSLQIDKMITEHSRLWLLRNKKYGCNEGIAPFIKIQKRIM